MVVFFRKELCFFRVSHPKNDMYHVSTYIIRLRIYLVVVVVVVVVAVAVAVVVGVVVAVSKRAVFFGCLIQKMTCIYIYI